MTRADRLSYLTGIARFVERRVIEGNAEAADLAGRRAGRERRHGARINASAEQHADRYIGDHLALDGLAQRPPKLSDVLRLAEPPSFAPQQVRIVVALQVCSAGIEQQKMTGRKLTDLPQDRTWRRDIVGGQVLVDRSQ